MSKATVRPVISPIAAEVCRQFELSDAGHALLRPDQTADTFAHLLVENALHADAIRFWAHRLPKKEAIWWGCLCLWGCSRPEPAPEAAAALRAVVEWLRDDKEENRRRAEAVGRAAGINTPAGALAMAAFWSAGSIAPPDRPKVEAPAVATAQAVAGAIIAAAATSNQPQFHEQFDALAREVADGKNRWQ